MDVETASQIMTMNGWIFARQIGNTYIYREIATGLERSFTREHLTTYAEALRVAIQDSEHDAHISN